MTIPLFFPPGFASYDFLKSFQSHVVSDTHPHPSDRTHTPTTHTHT